MLDLLNKMAAQNVTIYTSPTCGYCKMAKQLLTDLKIPFSEVDVAENEELRSELVNKYHWQTVPMIFIGENFIGGFDDLNKLHQEGKLVELYEE